MKDHLSVWGVGGKGQERNVSNKPEFLVIFPCSSYWDSSIQTMPTIVYTPLQMQCMESRGW